MSLVARHRNWAEEEEGRRKQTIQTLGLKLLRMKQLEQPKKHRCNPFLYHPKRQVIWVKKFFNEYMGADVAVDPQCQFSYQLRDLQNTRSSPVRYGLCVYRCISFSPLLAVWLAHWGSGSSATRSGLGRLCQLTRFPSENTAGDLWFSRSIEQISALAIAQSWSLWGAYAQGS